LLRLIYRIWLLKLNQWITLNLGIKKFSPNSVGIRFWNFGPGDAHPHKCLRKRSQEIGSSLVSVKMVFTPQSEFFKFNFHRLRFKNLKNPGIQPFLVAFFEIPGFQLVLWKSTVDDTCHFLYHVKPSLQQHFVYKRFLIGSSNFLIFYEPQNMVIFCWSAK